MGPEAKERTRWRTNNYGWNSAIDYTADAGLHQQLIAIIGDSYIEGFSVNVTEALPALIRQWAGNQAAVYSFGISGAPLSQYLNMARYVDEVFKPAILVINVVHNDFDESLASIVRKPDFLQLAEDGNGFKEIPPTPFANSFFLRLCRLSATFRYIEINCQVQRLFRRDFWFAKPDKYNANIDPREVRKNHLIIQRATGYLVEKFARENPHKQIIFMMDGPRFDIYNHNLKNSNVIWLNHMLGDTVRAHHLEFIDLTMPFADYFYKYGKWLNSPVDAHWNAVGHRVAARALWQKLQRMGVVTARPPASKP